MNKLAKEIDLLERKLKLINENYSLIITMMVDLQRHIHGEVDEFRSNDDHYSSNFYHLRNQYQYLLNEKQFQRIGETKQIDLEDSIKEIKHERNTSNNK